MVRHTIRRLATSESGSEIIQLALTLPLLLGLFGISAQVSIWIFSAIQFSAAAESVAYQANLETITSYGSDSIAAQALVTQEIAERMVGGDANRLTVIDVETTTSARSQSATIGSGSQNDLVSNLTRTDTTGTLSFTARYECPSILGIGEALVLEHRWTRDRLVSRRAEVE